MKRREFFGRSLWGSLTAALAGAAPVRAREFPPGYDASAELASPDWTPVFLDAHQNDTLIRLSDLIIPETDTPGAKAALVNRFIDRLLASESRETQSRFLDALAWFDGECLRRYRAAFLHLPDESQLEFLNFVAYPHKLVTWKDNRSEFPGHSHFLTLKDWISRAFYNSEAGLKELGWIEDAMSGSFPGCPHPEGHHK